MSGVVSITAEKDRSDVAVMPIQDNWWGYETNAGRIVIKIWKKYEDLTDAIGDKNIKQVFLPMVKAHTRKEAQRLLLDRYRYTAIDSPF